MRDVYVATKYNVRITTQHPTGPYTGRQFSVDRDPAYLACFLVGDGATVSVQGCRYRIRGALVLHRMVAVQSRLYLVFVGGAKPDHPDRADAL